MAKKAALRRDALLRKVSRSADEVAERLHALGPAGADAAHRLFAELYFATTMEWLRLARCSKDPAQLHLLVIHFHQLFDRYVLQLESGAESHTTVYWRRYFEAHGGSTTTAPSLKNALALLLAIRAHTRFDLAEALCAMYASYRREFGRDPDLSLLKSEIYGPTSDRIFKEACGRFFTRRATQDRSWELLRRAAALTGWAWLPVLQAGRKVAWNEATVSIASGSPISRERRAIEARARVA